MLFTEKQGNNLLNTLQESHLKSMELPYIKKNPESKKILNEEGSRIFGGKSNSFFSPLQSIRKGNSTKRDDLYDKSIQSFNDQYSMIENRHLKCARVNSVKELLNYNQQRSPCNNTSSYMFNVKNSTTKRNFNNINEYYGNRKQTPTEKKIISYEHGEKRILTPIKKKIEPVEIKPIIIDDGDSEEEKPKKKMEPFDNLLLPEKFLTEPDEKSTDQLGTFTDRPTSNFICYKDQRGQKGFKTIERSLGSLKDKHISIQNEQYFNNSSHILIKNDIVQRTFDAYSHAQFLDGPRARILQKKPKIKIFSKPKEVPTNKDILANLKMQKVRPKQDAEIAMKIVFASLALKEGTGNDPAKKDNVFNPLSSLIKVGANTDNQDAPKTNQHFYNKGNEQYQNKLPGKRTEFTIDKRLKSIKRQEMIFFTTSDTSLRTDVRDGHTLTFYQSEGYLLGGVGNKQAMETVTVWDAFNEQFKYNKIEKYAPEDRSFHSAELIKKNIFMFGGEIISGPNRRERNICNELWKLNCCKMEWSKVCCSGNFIMPRKSHASCSFNKFMVVHGGIIEELKYINDFYVFVSDKHVWQRIDIPASTFNKEAQIKNIANHKMVAVFQFPNCQELYGQAKNYPVNPEINFSDRVTYEGLYIFGGRYENQSTSNSLFVVLTNLKPWKIIEPEVMGVKPPSRYGHSMIHNKEKNILYIYGGKNNDMFQTSGKSLQNDKFRSQCVV